MRITRPRATKISQLTIDADLILGPYMLKFENLLIKEHDSDTLVSRDIGDTEDKNLQGQYVIGSNRLQADMISELTDEAGVLVDGVENKNGKVDGVDVDAHKTRHQNGGADEITVAGLSGLLADVQNPKFGTMNVMPVTGAYTAEKQFCCLNIPSAGNYTFTCQLKVESGATATIWVKKNDAGAPDMGTTASTSYVVVSTTLTGLVAGDIIGFEVTSSDAAKDATARGLRWLVA